MLRSRFTWISAVSCLCVASSVSPAMAQLGISFDPSGSVRVQNGNAAPLVVGPGQSFGGTLTPQGFQGVTSSSGVAVGVSSGSARTSTPFDSPAPAATAASGISVSLPGLNVSTSGSGIVIDPRRPDRLQTARDVARTSPPAAALKLIDDLLVTSPHQPDLLQLKATLLVQEHRMKDAAACAYDAMSSAPAWSWAVLRSRFASMDQVSQVYRDLQQEAVVHPSLETDFVLGWWEEMLGHHAEAMTAMQRVQALRPNDALVARLVQDWFAAVQAETPPAAR